MNIESVKSLFTLISGEDDFEKFMPLITLAVTETENMLISEVSTYDIRIEFLCAAVANYRLQQINSAHDRSESTYAGKMLTNSGNNNILKYAEKLLKDYLDLCENLIKPKTFVFMGFCGESGGIYNA